MIEWIEQALCREVGSDPFFGDKGSSAKTAKRICAKCDVSAQCLEYALSLSLMHGQPVKGIWGGTTERDRRQLRKSLAAS